MKTQPSMLEISGIQVELIRKHIKYLRLSILPPDGHVRISAPFNVSNKDIRLAFTSRLGWIRRHQAKFAEQERQLKQERAHGESCYFMGSRYCLVIEEKDAPPQVRLQGGNRLILQVRPGTKAARRAALLNDWYRLELKRRIPALLQTWAPVVGVKIPTWGIRRMKTRWGSCNVAAKRIWLNLELIKKPPECLEYVLVHELVHLLERRHNQHFRTLMDQFMPEWRVYRDEVKKFPKVHEEWGE